MEWSIKKWLIKDLRDRILEYLTSPLE